MLSQPYHNLYGRQLPMSHLEPYISPAPRGRQDIRWRWWYSAIADWMIRHPDKTLPECAKELGRTAATIQAIVRSDIFKEYFARRKTEWAADHDYALRARLTGVAEKGLDLILENMKTKGPQIPIQRLESLTVAALDRLGYAPASTPAVVIDQRTQDNRTQVVQVKGVTPQLLEEARMALRTAEARRAGSSLTPPPVPNPIPEQGPAVLDAEVGMSVDDLAELMDEGGVGASPSND